MLEQRKETLSSMRELRAIPGWVGTCARAAWPLGDAVEAVCPRSASPMERRTVEDVVLAQPTSGQSSKSRPLL